MILKANIDGVASYDVGDEIWQVALSDAIQAEAEYADRREIRRAGRRGSPTVRRPSGRFARHAPRGRPLERRLRGRRGDTSRSLSSKAAWEYARRASIAGVYASLSMSIAE